MTDTEYEITVDSEFAASTSGPVRDAAREAMHYVAQYASEGEVRVYEVTRREVTLGELAVRSA